ncbi:MAG TPA: M48 family metalloprotease [Alphaproteobacteria bacterium]|nr:M48 family metalloprotease [Alphaproteobacteria bacterium]HNS43611.1 M48 family metalloprotease [Alphaproteobacteria bacterium]
MALSTIGLSTSRWNARNKSIALMAVFPGIVLVTAYWQIRFLTFYFADRYATDTQPVQQADSLYWILAPFIAVGLIVWFYMCLKDQDKIIEGLFHAYQIDRRDNPDLYNMVETLAIQLGQPVPEVFIIPTIARNAMASSLSDGTDRIYVTSGLLEFLAHDEVEAVIAHEYGHILSHDTRWVGLSIIFTNLFSGVPQYFKSENKFERLDEEKSLRQLEVFFYSLLLFPIWIGYAAISVLRVFLLIEREHDADMAAVQITKNPDALMRALIRIHRRARIPYVPKDVMFLCIDNPRGGFFATHPRLFARLRHISRLTQTEIPQIEESSEAPIYKRFTKNKLLQRTFKPFKKN